MILTIGTLLYNYYQHKIINYEYIIQECRSLYKNIHHDVQHYHNLYHRDAQISNWDLKEMIIDNNQASYPFMTYYISLIKTSYHLHARLTALNKQLIKITHYKKQLYTNKYSEKKAYLQEMFQLLEMKGKELKKYIIETITLIIILKNKLKLFKEYHNDCHHWSQTTQKIKTINHEIFFYFYYPVTTSNYHI